MKNIGKILLGAIPIVSGLLKKDDNKAGKKLNKIGNGVLGATNLTATPVLLILFSDPELLQQFFDMGTGVGYTILIGCILVALSGNVIGYLAKQEGKKKVSDV